MTTQMKRLMIVSNRLPLSVVKDGDQFNYIPSVGGLATGLKSFYKDYNGKWIGWPGIEKNKIGQRSEELKKKLAAEDCIPVNLTGREITEYYDGFSNNTIWPLFHYFPQYTSYDNSLFRAYQKVNEKFCESILEVAREGDYYWIHDYHLMLLPAMLRKARPDLTIGFFLHIPFPSYEIFRLLPWREEIVEGLLGADLIGFHTHDYARHFFSTVKRIAGYDHDYNLISTESRRIRVDVFPISIDYEKFAGAVNLPETRKIIANNIRKVGDQKIILSVDRLDYSKGIDRRLASYELFLDRFPKYRGKTTLILVVVPSRTDVEQYQLLKVSIEELVGRINGKYGDIGYTPISYLYRSLPFEELAALYTIADVALVTPMRDGMNLVAKEYLAAKTDETGMLVLSEMAGASTELGEAISVNPNNEYEISSAIKRALEMSDSEKLSRNQVMRKRIKRYDISRWAQDFIDRLKEASQLQAHALTRILTPSKEKEIISAYAKAKKRLLLLDYDGTLVGFQDRPAAAVIDDKMHEAISVLSDAPGNSLVIISGRDRAALEQLLNGLDVNLVCEHGVWLKKKGEPWQMADSITSGWEPEIRPILEFFVDRTPGSFIEDKEYSLAWHYRKSEHDLGPARAGELVAALQQMVENRNLDILEGDKVVEVRSSGINKGRAATRWIGEDAFDFILAMGDDKTDEDTFAALPPEAWSIKVGLGMTLANFNLFFVDDSRSFLCKLAGLKAEKLKK